MKITEFCDKHGVDKKTLYRIKSMGLIEFDSNGIDEIEGLEALHDYYHNYRDVTRAKNPEWRPPPIPERKIFCHSYLFLLCWEILRSHYPEIEKIEKLESKQKNKISGEPTYTPPPPIPETLKKLINEMNQTRSDRMKYYENGYI